MSNGDRATAVPNACTSCGKEFRWKPELAGKKAKCKCGSVISVPAKPPAPPAQKAERSRAFD